MIGNNGKFSGWTMVGICWLVGLFVGAPWTFGMSILMPRMVRSLHLSATQVGVGLSTMGAMSAVGFLLAAWLIRRIGIRWTMTGGLVLLVMAFVLLGSVVHTFLGFFLVFGILAAVGFALAGFLPMQNLVSSWFTRNRGTAMSVMISGTGLGGLIWAITVSRLLQANYSWQATVFVFAVGGLVSAVLTAVFVRNKPSDLGQLPDGGQTGAAVGTRRTYQTKVQWDAKDVFRTRAYWLILIPVALTQGVAVPTILGFQGIAMASVRMPLATVGFVVGGMGVFMLLGNLIVGPVSDHVDNRYVFGIVIVCAIVGLGSFTILSPATVSYASIIYVVLFGIGSGSTYVLAPVMLANYFGYKSYASFGAVAGVFVALMSLVFPTITGRIYDTTGSCNGAWYLIMGLLALAIICITLAVPPKPGNIAAEEVEAGGHGWASTTRG